MLWSADADHVGGNERKPPNSGGAWNPETSFLCMVSVYVTVGTCLATTFVLADQKLTLAVDNGARAFLAKAGYDPQFGARPLKRAIQQHLLDPLALKLLDGDFKPGDAITAKVKQDSVEFSIAE